MTAMGLLIAASTITGCSGSTESKTTTKSAPPSPIPAETAQASNVPVHSLTLSSPAFTEGQAIPAHYTCDGANVPPPLHWSPVPKETKSLALLISDESKTPGGHSPIIFALAGLPPTLTELDPSKLPPSAIIGRNSNGHTGYNLCPKRHTGKHHYTIALYAPTRPLPVKQGFSANTLSTTLEHTPGNIGLIGFTYERK